MIKIIEKPTSELIPYNNNARINDKAVEAVANSIKEFGFKNPIIVDSGNVIIAGHTRLKAAERLGILKVPCIVADDLTDDQIKAFRIADNSTAQVAEWDMAKLEQELASIDLDMTMFGLDEQIKEIEKLSEKEVTEDDFDIQPPDEPVSKQGETYRLGNHYLHCGDATSDKALARLMGGGVVDMLLTDPPYNVNYEGKTSAALKIENDNMEYAAFAEFLNDSFSNIATALKPGGAWYIFHSDTESESFRRAARKNLGKVRQCLIWNKNGFVMGMQDYHWKHEPCLYGWKDGAAHYFTDDRTQSTVYEDKGIDFKKLKKDEAIKMLEDIFSDKQSTTVINEDKPLRNTEHPTMKPLKLLARLIRNSTKPGEAVLDPFGGSGSTLIACEQLGRKCYTMELDPRYADVIIERWETLTGQKAVKI